MADQHDPENWGSESEFDTQDADEPWHNAGEAEDPDQQLEELKAQRAQVQAEIAKDTTRLKALDEDIQAFTDVTAIIEQILKAYDQALPDLITRQKEAKGYSDTKMRMILCAVEDVKEAIDEKIAKYDLSIKRKEQRVQQLEQKKVAAGHESAEADVSLTTKQERFNYWKDYQTNLDNNLKETSDLKLQIENEDSQSHTASMYFLARELGAVLEYTKIINHEQLSQNLKEAWNELNEAKTYARDKKAAWDAAIAAFDAAQTELADARKTRRQRLLAAVNEFNPQKKAQSGPQY
jgi:hypothetical protein